MPGGRNCLNNSSDEWQVTSEESSLNQFIARLPKVELHVHLEGAARPESLRELARRKRRLEKETEEWISERRAQKFRYRKFQDFLEAYKRLTLLLESPSDYALVTTRLSEDLARENVKYAEVTLSAGVILWKKQPVEAVFEAISRAASDARARCGVRIQWIFDAVRHFGVEHARQVLALAARFRSQGVVAFGIGGDEERGPAEQFVDVFREARELGLHATAHAGETSGPESVRKAIEILGAERIGHGLTAAEDGEVLALLRKRKVPVEVCLTSNVATGLLARVEDHPLKRYLDAGLVVTLNSDDPGMFETNLEREMKLAAEHFALSRAQLAQISENAIRASFLPEGSRRELLEELHSAVGR